MHADIKVREPKSNPKKPAVGAVIEAKLGKGRGPVATVLLQEGTLRVGDAIVVAPNEEHWHGAGSRGRFAHLVTNLGDTRWLEASPAPPD